MRAVRRSPGTFIMLAILVTTSVVVLLLIPDLAHGITRHVSSNLHHLQQLRFGTLIGSAFWLDDADELLPWTLLFLVVQAPAEAWLGTWRWIIVFAIGHVGATLATVGGVWMAIRWDLASHQLARSADVGVSYGFFAVAAILTYRISVRWRGVYIVGLLAYPLASIAIENTFTDDGHLVAIGIGWALYPLTKARLPRGPRQAVART